MAITLAGHTDHHSRIEKLTQTVPYSEQNPIEAGAGTSSGQTPSLPKPPKIYTPAFSSLPNPVPMRIKA